MSLWLFRRFIFQKKILTEPTTLFSLFGIALGVAFLVVSMAGFSGFSNTLKRSIIDVSGDIVIYKRGGRISNPEPLVQKMKSVSNQIEYILPYVQLETLIANKGQLSAVFLQGVDSKNADKVLNLKKRIVKELPPGQEGIGQPAHLGTVVAKQLKLNVGDSFKGILPRVSKTSATQINPKVENFYVKSIMDFGKYEFNERIVITEKSTVQALAGIDDQINGFRLKLKSSDRAEIEADKIQDAIGWDYVVRDWSKTNRSLFKAIQYEKRVLFFVMLIMVVAAFFNVSTTLFLGVLRKYAQVSVLRALGLKKWQVILLFCLNGFALGVIGLTVGIALGLLFCWGFENLQKVYPIMPEEVYKLSTFMTDLKFMDIVWVIVATLVICFVSSLAPAFRGANLSPVEGLKYE
ncbi:MAG: ABC transporter permease [Bdellovibrionales bacterium]|nr:ABC transporter permease [Bdellovibrionales bacterium]